MKYTILGANSFTGGHFARYLKSCGEDVLCVPRHDINSEEGRNAIAGAVERSSPDFLVNFISRSLVNPSWEHPEDWFLTNVTSTTALLKRLKSLKMRYVHVSTPEVYGSGRHTEDSAFNPSTPYAVSRASMEMMLRIWDLDCVITRSGNVYGPGQKNKIIPKAIECFDKGEVFEMEGNGESRRQFVHVLDVCRATKLVAEKGEGAYNISTNRLWSMNEVIDLIGCKMKYVTDRRRKDEYYDLVTDKIKSLGWYPTLSLEEGLKTCIPLQSA